jgi:pyruvate dehydrogenase E2 component (dihydrolipoamide acetyltransferase)
MASAVIMPALELAQETGKVLRWLKAPGDPVAKGEAIAEIETDKVTIELEAPASGILGELAAQEGDVVPVGQAIATILAPGEAGAPARAAAAPAARVATAGSSASAGTVPRPASTAPGLAAATAATSAAPAPTSIKASPLARRLAAQHGVDLAQIKTSSGKIEKADVLAHVEARQAAGNGAAGRLVPASPKARRLAAERGVDLGGVRGSGPSGAILTADVLAAAVPTPAAPPVPAAPAPAAPAAMADARPGARPAEAVPVGTVWRIMAERMTASWTSAPHFYLVREVDVTRLIAWRAHAVARAGDAGPRLTYTDMLVKLVAAALVRHPAANTSWRDGAIARNAEVNVGLAVAVEAGLVVPVLHGADALGLAEIAARREDVVARAQAGRLRPADIQGGGFTISNLGMYGVDAFSAIVNPPQAAILAVGRIADRVVAVNGQPAVRPTMVLTLSCDHRALDGARAAEFLGALADLVEEPLALLS